MEVALQIEPINATSLECMSLGAATSFKYVAGLTLREAKAMAPASLPEDLRAASFCDDFDLKVELCARTWRRPHPQSALMDIVPLGSCKTDFNFDATTYKRILNVVVRAGAILAHLPAPVPMPPGDPASTILLLFSSPFFAH